MYYTWRKIEGCVGVLRESDDTSFLKANGKSRNLHIYGQHRCMSSMIYNQTVICLLLYVKGMTPGLLTWFKPVGSSDRCWNLASSWWSNWRLWWWNCMISAMRHNLRNIKLKKGPCCFLIAWFYKANCLLYIIATKKLYHMERHHKILLSLVHCLRRKGLGILTNHSWPRFLFSHVYKGWSVRLYHIVTKSLS